MNLLQISIDLKKQVENIICFRCKRTRLTFKSAEFDGEFRNLEGDGIVVYTYCKTCKTDSAVVVNIAE